MSVIIGADNGTISGSGGLKITGDSSGIVQLTSGANTTTMTLNYSAPEMIANIVAELKSLRAICAELEAKVGA
jgi:hypothetical protein